MPTIQRFGAFKIEMFFNDHLPPHVHVTGPDFRALVSIRDADVIAGDIPHKYCKEALSWVAENREMLLEKWDEFN
jgi:Domain of unknown function (DUF4160)